MIKKTHKIIKNIFPKFKKNQTKNKLIQTIQTQSQKISQRISPVSTNNILKQLKQETISH